MQRIKVVCQPDPKASPAHDSIDFAHSQTLEIIQYKARRACLALEATTSVLRCIDSCLTEICRRESEMGRDINESHQYTTLRSESAQMNDHLGMHMRKARDIVENVGSVNMLVSCRYIAADRS